MNDPIVPQTSVGLTLRDRIEREAIYVLLIGNLPPVDQCVIELERRGFCDSYAWSPPVPLPEDVSLIQYQSGAIVRLYKRWYPFTSERIPL